MVHKTLSDWPKILAYVPELERAGVVTRTFRRLDPQRQQLIVHAILDEAIEKGPAAINIKKVAERAGVAVGSLYQYFGNRDGLMEFSVQLCVHLLNGAFAEFKPILVALPLREALYYYLTGGVEWGKTLMGLIQFFGRAAYEGTPELSKKVVRPVAIAMRETMHEILLAAQAHGELRADVDIEAASRAINAWMIALGDSQLLPYLNTYFQVSDETVPFERTLEASLDILLLGLSPSGGTA